MKNRKPRTLTLPRRPDPLRLDPTGTAFLKRALSVELRKVFNHARTLALNCGGPGSGKPGPCPIKAMTPGAALKALTKLHKTTQNEHERQAVETAVKGMSGGYEFPAKLPPTPDHFQLIRRLVSARHQAREHDLPGLDHIMSSVGIERIGERGSVVPFSGLVHQSEHSVHEGQPVRIEHPGYHYKKESYIPLKATVVPATHNSLVENKTYDYATTQFNVTDPRVTGRIERVRGRLESDDVLRYDDEPHVTVRYGLHDGEDIPDRVSIIAEGSGPVVARFGNLTAFEQDDKDVLKFDVEGQGLESLHRSLGLLPHTDTHPEYRPHLTVAYLKPGTAQKYINDPSLSLKGVDLTLTELTYSSKVGDKREVVINCGGVGGKPGPCPIRESIYVDEEHHLHLHSHDPETKELEYQYRNKQGHTVGILNVRYRSDYGVSVIEHSVSGARGRGLGRKGLLAMSHEYQRIHSLAFTEGKPGGPSENARKAWASLQAYGAVKRKLSNKGKEDRYVWEVDQTKHTHNTQFNLNCGGPGGKPGPCPTGVHEGGGSTGSLVSRMLSATKSLPKAIVNKVVTSIKAQYTKMEARYGPRYAKAIVGAAVLALPLPLPGSSVIAMGVVRGVAELHRMISGPHQAKAAPALNAATLTPDQIYDLAFQFIRDLYRELGGLGGGSVHNARFDDPSSSPEKVYGLEFWRPFIERAWELGAGRAYAKSVQPTFVQSGEVSVPDGKAWYLATLKSNPGVRWKIDELTTRTLQRVLDVEGSDPGLVRAQVEVIGHRAITEAARNGGSL